MQLYLSIREVYFDEIRRGKKLIEYRPKSSFYITRFSDRYITEIIFGHQGMQDRLTCRVNIVDGVVPTDTVKAWYEIYKEPHDDVYAIEILGPPKHSYCSKQKLKGYPRKFLVVA